MIKILTTVIMVAMMSFIITLVMTIVNVGIDNFVWWIWLRSWIIAFCIAAPLAYFLPEKISKILTKLIKSDS